MRIFIVANVNIYYDSGSELQYSLKEIRNVARYLREQIIDTSVLESDFIACGDFNIEMIREEILRRTPTEKGPKVLKQIFDVMTSEGLTIPNGIRNSPSNFSKTKHFDQIGYYIYNDSTIKFLKGGMIDFVGAVYVGDPKAKYKFTDHLPI